ncbi:MAG: hypothetical protein Q8Q88_17435 [Phenylobacterium sp.]|nr:hypothetical protein [Phenylobacterium sp.]MDP3748824.1 hypothetical protein [Phenylobacterium sp.]
MRGAGRRLRTVVPRLAEVVDRLAHAFALDAEALAQLALVGRDAVDGPVVEGAAAVRHVGILDYEHEALRLGRRAGPAQWR